MNFCEKYEIALQDGYDFCDTPNRGKGRFCGLYQENVLASWAFFSFNSQQFTWDKAPNFEGNSIKEDYVIIEEAPARKIKIQEIQDDHGEKG